MIDGPANDCPRCGTRLPAGALAGLCPDCLIRFTLRPLAEARVAREAEPAETPPSRLGDFELIEPIGQGGMGEVWRARQISLNRIVALKTIQAQGSRAEALQDRFRFEAEAAATLSHPHIVPIFEVGVAEGHAFLAMRLIEGGTLAEHLAEGRWSTRHCPAHRTPILPWPWRPRCCPQGAALVATLARAVHHAHQHGVLHRDLKPGNILLDEDGQPHIADFGLARWSDLASATLDQDEIVGTPAYMAPEQAAGNQPTTTAADLYSLGAVLYHILTGRPPVLTESGGAACDHPRDTVPPAPRLLNPDVDRDLEAICLKCLAQDPAERYASAASLADDLDRWSRAEDIRARASTRGEQLARWFRRRPAVAGLSLALGVALLGGLTGIVSQWLRAERNAAAALASAHRAHDRLVRMHVANGVRAVEAGDLLGALPWFAEAERLDPANDLHRLCLAGTLRMAPKLAAAWHLGAPVTDAAWTPDGSGIAACAESGAVLVTSVAPTGHVVTPIALPARALRLAIAPAGAPVAVAGADGRVRLLERGATKFRELPGAHTAAVRALAFGPTGQHLASGGQDGAVCLWSLDHPNALPRVLAHLSPVFDVAFSPDGALLLAGTHEGTVTLWRATDATRVDAPVRASAESLFTTQFSPDGNRFLTAGADGGARLWTVENLRAVGTRMSHGTWVAWAGHSPNGRYVATCSEDTTARLWDATDGRPLSPPLRHEGPLTQGGFDARSRRFATAGGEQAVRLWSVPDGGPIGAPLRHGGAITRLVWQPSGDHLLTGSSDGFVRVWEPTATPPSVLPFEGFTCWNVWFTPGDDRLIVSGPPGRVRLWDATNAQPASPLLAHPALVDAAVLAPDGRWLLTACRDGRARIWELATGREIAAFPVSNAVSGVLWSPDGRSCAAFTDEPVIHVFDSATGRALQRLEAGNASVFRAAFGPGGQRLAVGYRDGAVRLWDLAGAADARHAPKPVAARGHAGLVRCLRFSPDGRALLTAGQDGIGRLLEASTGTPLGLPMAHSDAVTDARFDASGQRVVTASADGTARVWAAGSGAPVISPIRPRGGARDAVFSPDGRWLLTINAQTVQVWDAATGTPVLPPFAPERPVAGAAFSPDSQRLYVVSERPRLYTVDLARGDWTLDDWQFVARFLSCREVDATGGLTTWSARLERADTEPAAGFAARWERLNQSPRLTPATE